MTFLRHRLLWPVVMLALLLLCALIFSDGFFDLRIQDGHLFGTPINILRASAPLVLVALGMTLVISTGGIDLSVGSVMAVSGAMACMIIGDLGDQNSVGGVAGAVAAAIALSLVLGLATSPRRSAGGSALGSPFVPSRLTGSVRSSPIDEDQRR